MRELNSCLFANQIERQRFVRPADTPASLLREKIATPRPDRIHWLFVALEGGMSSKEVVELTKIDPWFVQQMQEIVAVNRRLASVTVETVPEDLLREAKRMGASANAAR